MRSKDYTKSRTRSALGKAIVLPILIILSACATSQTPPPIGTAQGQIEPLACTELPSLKYNTGNKDATPTSVDTAMAAHPDDPLGWARGELGDTLSTRSAVSDNYAARKALGCKNP